GELVRERLAAVEAVEEAARLRLAEIGPPAAEIPPLPAVPEHPVRLRVEVEALRRDRTRLEAGVTRARREMASLAAEDPVELRRAGAPAEAHATLLDAPPAGAEGPGR